jgi:4a-hydroxytetrahydrobiopterin dehydratase
VADKEMIFCHNFTITDPAASIESAFSFNNAPLELLKMTFCSTDPLAQKRCLPCEGGVEKLTPQQIEPLILQIPSWQITSSGDAIARKFKFRDFVSALAFINHVGEIAEAEQHHPDLHLTGYRHVTIEITTHAIGGLSENDFILAAKIDAVAANGD